MPQLQRRAGTATETPEHPMGDRHSSTQSRAWMADQAMSKESFEPRELVLSACDGYPLGVTLFPALRPRKLLIIGPALAVPKAFYYPFARYLASRDITAICFDYRGCGDSVATKDPFHVELKEWGQKDIETVIRFAMSLRDSNQRIPLHFLGHSIGGQLVGLAPSSIYLSKLLLVGASAPHWRRWAFPANLKMLLISRILMPLVSSFTSMFPSRAVGLGKMNVPSSVTRQWSRWMSKPAYFFDPAFQIDTSPFTALSSSLLALGFADDPLAPESNIHALLSFFPGTIQELCLVRPERIGLGAVGHVGFFRAQFRDTLWSATVEWLSCDIQFETALANCIHDKQEFNRTGQDP